MTTPPKRRPPRRVAGGGVVCRGPRRAPGRTRSFTLLTISPDSTGPFFGRFGFMPSGSAPRSRSPTLRFPFWGWTETLVAARTTPAHIRPVGPTHLPGPFSGLVQGTLRGDEAVDLLTDPTNEAELCTHPLEDFRHLEVHGLAFLERGPNPGRVTWTRPGSRFGLHPHFHP